MKKYTYSFYLAPPPPPPKKKKKKKKSHLFLYAFRVPVFRFITVEFSAGLISDQWGGIVIQTFGVCAAISTSNCLCVSASQV